MTEQGVMVEDVTMIYSKEQLLEMFEKGREKLGMSKLAYGKKIGVDYERVKSWFRPERVRGKINYEDAMRIIDAITAEPPQNEIFTPQQTTAAIKQMYIMLQDILNNVAHDRQHLIEQNDSIKKSAND